MSKAAEIEYIALALFQGHIPHSPFEGGMERRNIPLAPFQEGSTGMPLPRAAYECRRDAGGTKYSSLEGEIGGMSDTGDRRC